MPSSSDSASVSGDRRRVPADPANLRRFLEATAASTFGVSAGEIGTPQRGSPSVAFARQVAMYIAHVEIGLTLSDTGRMFGRDRTTAAHACRLVEDRRDDPRLDAALSAITRSVAVWLDIPRAAR